MADEVSRTITRYYSEVARTSPIEDPEEERRLILAWQRKKDTASRDALVHSHLRFVISLAHKRTSDPEKRADLIAAGNLGLLKALDRFDVRKRTRFLTYAGWWIQEEMFKEDYATSSLVHVPTHRQKAQRKRVKEYNKALAEHGPESSKTKNLTPAQPEGATVPIEVLWDLHDEIPANRPEQFDIKDTNHRLRRAISRLPVREQTVLNLYFGVKEDPRNFVQIANMLGMSPERVRQIKISGMRLLKDALESKHAITSTLDAY